MLIILGHQFYGQNPNIVVEDYFFSILPMSGKVEIVS